MRVLILNQYFPPDSAPTGIYLKEVAEALRSDGHEVNLIGSERAYRNSYKKSGRLWREILDLWELAKRGIRSKKPDVIIAGTSPPCLPIVAMLLSGWFKARLIHWAFDVYPDLAVALGEIKPGFASHAIGWMMKASYRACDKVLTLDDDMRVYFSKLGIESEVVEPWPLVEMLDRVLSEEAPVEPGGLWTWIYSGNLGRAHEWETLLQAQAILEQKMPSIHLSFQGGGASWPAAQQRARELGLQNCHWLPYVAESELQESLLKAQCCIATQRSETKGLLWPSKLSLLMQLPRPIAWVGPKSGAIAKRLETFPVAGKFESGEGELLAEWVLSLAAKSVSCIPPIESAKEIGISAWQRIARQWVLPASPKLDSVTVPQG